MSDAHRYFSVKLKTITGSSIDYKPSGPLVVFADHYDDLMDRVSRLESALRDAKTLVGSYSYRINGASAIISSIDMALEKRP